jgi:hypothetical protein
MHMIAILTAGDMAAHLEMAAGLRAPLVFGMHDSRPSSQHWSARTVVCSFASLHDHGRVWDLKTRQKLCKLG